MNEPRSDTTMDPNPTPQAAAPRRNNWLIASVALNVFLIGGISSALLLGPLRPPPGFGGGGRPPMHGFGLGPDAFLDGLSDAGRQTVQVQRAADEAAIGAQLAALRAAREAMDQAFAAEPFDREGFEAAFGRLREAETTMSARMGERVAALAARLSPEDRRAFARNLRRLGPPMGPPMGPPPGGSPGSGPPAR